MPPTPLYPTDAAEAAYQLRFAWTGWPSSKRFPGLPVQLIERTKPLWEQDGLRVLEHRWTEEMVQILFSTRPDVSPVFSAARAKGRLDHALRQEGLDMPFSRKVAVRSVGDNSRRDVEAYIERQVDKERFIDERFAKTITEMTVVNPQVDLSQPSESARGRYWYNLHLVLVVDGRVRLADLELLRVLRDAFFTIANKKQHAVSRLSVMPDHLHAAIRAQPEESPAEIAFSYQNNLAYLARRGRIWRAGYYVGTFGEYTMQAVRNRTGTA
jgi:REP element-mobilizing transposase RayT